MSPRLTLLCSMVVALSVTPAAAITLYVDNLAGDDTFNGRAPVPAADGTGPVRSIARAVRLAEAGDVIEVFNTGVPYYGPISMEGVRHSGLGDQPFTINGNGAVVDGSLPVPRGAWSLVGGNLWVMTPLRKGHYQLVLEDRPVPEFRVPERASFLPEIPDGQWCAWRGSIYYHVPESGDPDSLPLRIAVPGVGLTLYEVRNVLVRDITFRHFRLDGINAHDRCRSVVLANVRCVANGRAGVTVAGTSEVVLRNCGLLQNLRHSLLVTELGAAEAVESQLDAPPTIEK